jgi:phenylpropionate dioxygenase-like ring-hydroxylating dioxygenase large terminal subunit
MYRAPSGRHATTIKAPQDEVETSINSKHQLSWTKQWYPVAIEDQLEPAEPQSVKLLGKTFVLWKDESGVESVNGWRAIDEV